MPQAPVAEPLVSYPASGDGHHPPAPATPALRLSQCRPQALEGSSHPPGEHGIEAFACWTPRQRSRSPDRGACRVRLGVRERQR